MCFAKHGVRWDPRDMWGLQRQFGGPYWWLYGTTSSLAPYLTPKPPVCKRFHHAASDTQDGIAKQPGRVERNSVMRSNQVFMVVPVPP